jgi:hypothetical protein
MRPSAGPEQTVSGNTIFRRVGHFASGSVGGFERRWHLSAKTERMSSFGPTPMNVQAPFVQPAIGTSIVVLGLLIALALRAPLWFGAMVGRSAVLPGYTIV